MSLGRDIRLLRVKKWFANEIWYYFILESFQTIQVYQNGDDAFDAITFDQQRDQIIVGAK
jgi:hypothetical protein